ncbi:hypothetical protein [Nocardiopsis sp. RV163]|uniref:hypothetical protein n=1 Tax=Nocardiopsis sp. RV163 TaxID=1661388 RepID=UPI00064BE0F9|nr:hypothetical protein [Nocardiopsis sp. RV163]
MTPHPPRAAGGADATNEVIVGPTGRPLRIPYFDMPTWMAYLPKQDATDAKAVGFAAWLWTFVNSQTQDFAFEVDVAAIMKRWGLSRSTVTSAPRKRSKGGLVERLAAMGILEIERRVTKTKDCAGCGTPQAYACPTSCTETKGRVRAAPRYTMAPTPPLGFLHPHPIDVGEATYPDRIDVRLHEEGPYSRLEAIERRRSWPYISAMTWVAYHPQVTLIDLAVYVVLCSRISTNEGRWATQVMRSTIGGILGIEDNTVGESTARLEHLGAIGKAGLNHRGEHRRGGGGATRYVVLEHPGAGLLHPLPLHAGEWRDPEQITARIDAVLAHRAHPQRPAHKPSDLPIVDNPGCPQGGMCARQRGFVRGAARVCALCGDRTNNPTNNPTNHPPSVGGQPQEQSPAPGGVDQALTDGDGSPRAEERHEAPAAASDASQDPLWPLVDKCVPRLMCRQGRADQEALIGRLRNLRERGYTDEALELVFDGISPERVLNPWAVASDRMRSVERLEEHLALVHKRKADAAAAKRLAANPGRCPVHGTAYVPEWSTPEVPYCLVCEREKSEEARDLSAAAAQGQGPTGPQETEDHVAEDPESKETGQALEDARNDAQARHREETRNRTSEGPSEALAAVDGALEDPGPQWSVPYCGRCQQDGRYKYQPRDVGGVIELVRVDCSTCHR